MGGWGGFLSEKVGEEMDRWDPPICSLRQRAMSISFSPLTSALREKKRRVAAETVDEGRNGGEKHTNQAQPDWILESYNGEDGQANPQSRLRVQRQPKKPLVR